MSDEQQTQQADDPSGDGWRWVQVGELLRKGDMFRDSDLAWTATTNAGAALAADGMHTYRRRIEPQQQQPSQDDPSGPGWRWVRQGEALRHGDVEHIVGDWHPTIEAGYTCPRNHSYRRRIEQPQPSDSEPETVHDLRRRLAECEVLLVEADRSGQQVNAELQQLREQVGTLTRERDRYRNQLAGAIEHSKAPEAQAKLVDRLQTWLRPVLEVVADHPDHSSILAASVLEFLPQIASRLIEE